MVADGLASMCGTRSYRCTVCYYAALFDTFDIVVLLRHFDGRHLVAAPGTHLVT